MFNHLLINCNIKWRIAYLISLTNLKPIFHMLIIKLSYYTIKLNSSKETFKFSYTFNLNLIMIPQKIIKCILIQILRWRNIKERVLFGFFYHIECCSYYILYTHHINFLIFLPHNQHFLFRMLINRGCHNIHSNII